MTEPVRDTGLRTGETSLDVCTQGIPQPQEMEALDQETSVKIELDIIRV